MLNMVDGFVMFVNVELFYFVEEFGVEIVFWKREFREELKFRDGMVSGNKEG
ncbi:hypothetical protein RchiOBHm_Chr6g0284011 [Rosa chinensis]|uniref:Uncharacterized protein n=1 Tax=Rosa chinensis TaxID=74649 RepID=A0A2P6PU53_ROSCH|nr:hypothetical protein RchiOBHm_Chr6g0284011 [Rosa chinensis]